MIVSGDIVFPVNLLNIGTSILESLIRMILELAPLEIHRLSNSAAVV